MVDQQDMFYREVLELSRNNTSKNNVLYTKAKVDELIDKKLQEKLSGKTFVEEIRCHASFWNAKAHAKTCTF